MNTKFRLYLLLFTGILCTNNLFGQSMYQAGILPAVNFNYGLKNNWSTNFKIESRQSLLSGTFNGNKDTRYNYVLTDYALLVAKKVGLSSRLAGGFLVRFREGQTVVRFIQQFALTQRLPSLRLSHRIVADQTFSEAEDTEFRLRYRLATELPLNGQSADAKEFYLKIQNEYLNSLQGSTYDLEVRLVPMLGYVATEQQRLEFGLDYRVNSFLDSAARHRFWISMNWYIVL